MVVSVTGFSVGVNPDRDKPVYLNDKRVEDGPLINTGANLERAKAAQGLRRSSAASPHVPGHPQGLACHPAARRG